MGKRQKQNIAATAATNKNKEQPHQHWNENGEHGSTLLFCNISIKCTQLMYIQPMNRKFLWFIKSCCSACVYQIHLDYLSIYIENICFRERAFSQYYCYDYYY